MFVAQWVYRIFVKIGAATRVVIRDFQLFKYFRDYLRLREFNGYLLAAKDLPVEEYFCYSLALNSIFLAQSVVRWSIISFIGDAVRKSSIVMMTMIGVLFFVNEREKAGTVLRLGINMMDKILCKRCEVDVIC